MAGFFQGEQSVFIGIKLVTRGADLVKQLYPLKKSRFMVSVEGLRIVRLTVPAGTAGATTI